MVGYTVFIKHEFDILIRPAVEHDPIAQGVYIKILVDSIIYDFIVSKRIVLTTDLGDFRDFKCVEYVD